MIAHLLLLFVFGNAASGQSALISTYAAFTLYKDNKKWAIFYKSSVFFLIFYFIISLNLSNETVFLVRVTTFLSASVSLWSIAESTNVFICSRFSSISLT